MSRRAVAQEFSEEEEEEYDELPQENDMDTKDKIIAQQRKMIKEMQKEFSATLDSLRAQLKEYVDESTEVQNSMLDRIKELKAELASLRKKSTKQTTTNQTAVRSSLYTTGPKHPRKLAQGTDARRSLNRQ